MKLTFIAACHNRRELTIRAAYQVLAASDAAGVESRLIVFDDGSTDGSADSLRKVDSRIQILTGDGNAFWAKSMAAAERWALENAQGWGTDYVVWINDDVDFDHDFVGRIHSVAIEHPGAVLVGAVREPDSHITSYSGLERAGVHPLNFRRVSPAESSVIPVQTFNGNLVWVPVTAAAAVGGIDGYFSHGLADIDYGLRCKRQNIAVLLAPGTYGECARNKMPRNSTFIRDWRSFTAAKGGGNFNSLRHILRKSNRFSWPVAIAATYSKWTATHALFAIRAWGRP